MSKTERLKTQALLDKFLVRRNELLDLRQRQAWTETEKKELLDMYPTWKIVSMFTEESMWAAPLVKDAIEKYYKEKP